MWILTCRLWTFWDRGQRSRSRCIAILPRDIRLFVSSPLCVVCSFSSVFRSFSHCLHFYQYFLKMTSFKTFVRTSKPLGTKIISIRSFITFLIHLSNTKLTVPHPSEDRTMLVILNVLVNILNVVSSFYCVSIILWPDPKNVFNDTLSIASSFSIVPVTLTSRSLASLRFGLL